MNPAHEPPVEFRIRAFRMHIARVGTSAAVLAGINFLTSPFVPWFLVPAAFMSISVLRRGGALSEPFVADDGAQLTIFDE